MLGLGWGEGLKPYSRRFDSAYDRVSEPAELQKNVILESDPEDDFDKYILYPVEVSIL